MLEAALCILTASTVYKLTAHCPWTIKKVLGTGFCEDLKTYFEKSWFEIPFGVDYERAVG